MPFCEPIDCSYLRNRQLRAEPDVSGIGITLSFVGSAALSSALLCIYYFFVFDPRKPPANRRAGASRGSVLGSSPSPDPWKPNVVDVQCLFCFRACVRKVLRLLPQGMRPKASSRPDLEELLCASIVSISDVQVLTSTAALATGFMTLSCGDSPLSAYHWQMVTLQVWLSSSTHLAGMTIIRGHLGTHSWRTIIRLALMAGVYLALVLAYLPTGYFEWGASFYGEALVALPSTPAACFFKTLYTSWSGDPRQVVTHCPKQSAPGKYGVCEWHPDHGHLSDSRHFYEMFFSVIVLTLGLVLRCYKIISPAPMKIKIRRSVGGILRRAFLWLAKPLGHHHEPQDEIAPMKYPSVLAKFYFHAIIRPALGFFLTLRLYFDVLDSLLIEVYGLFVAVSLGILRVNSARYVVSSPDTQWASILQAERQWAFGQIVPLFCLAAPVLCCAGTFLHEFNKSTTRDPEALMMEDLSRRSPAAHPPRGEIATDVAMSDEPAPKDSCAPDKPDWLTQDYYSTAPWILPCLISLFFIVCVVTVYLGLKMFPVHEGDGRQAESVWDLWFGSTNALPYVVFGFPLTCVSVLCFGLALDPWCRSWRCVTWKRLVVFCAAMAICVCYFLAFFFKSFYLFASSFISRFLLDGTVKVVGFLASSLYAIYLLAYISIALAIPALRKLGR
ncbi:hypothetical protein HIM_01378 [Hirsutella minnesotensis 3608]|nr:hypothetical protein HIM_01378 [Hirsutella minnesotensis 3608]